MIPGHLWIDEVYLHFISESEEDLKISLDVGEASGQTPGHIWIEGTDLHYIDADGNERHSTGIATGSSGIPGHLWIEDSEIHYIDANGDERYLSVTLPPSLFCQRNTCNVYSNNWYGPREWACPFKPCQTFQATSLAFKWRPVDGFPDPDWMRYCIYENGPGNIPKDPPIAVTGLKSPPWPTDLNVFTIWDLLTPVTLQVGINYWHILHAGKSSLPGYPRINSRYCTTMPHETCPSDIIDYYGQKRVNDLINPPGAWARGQFSHEYQVFGRLL